MPGNAISEDDIRICATATRVLIKVARRLADRTGHRAKIAASLANPREMYHARVIP